MRKFISLIIIIAHILATVKLPEAKAEEMESENYSIETQALVSGSKDGASVSSDMPINTIGEGVQGEASSETYNLLSGYAAQVKTSPPILKANIPYQLWDKGTALNNAFDLDDYFASLDDNEIDYSVQGNHNINVTIEAITHSVSFSQPPDFAGLETIKFIASDKDRNSTSSLVVKLLVKAPTNNPPVINLIEPIVKTENELAILAPTATDVDGDNITFSFSYPFDENGRWQTDYNDAGEYSAIITAKDATGLTDKLEVKVRVNNVNRQPILSPIAEISANEGELVRIYPQAQDPDGDPVTFIFGAPFNSQGRWQTNYTDHGVKTITVIASDGNLSVSEDVVVTINDVQVSPVVSVNLSSSVVNKDEQITINVQASDPDNDAMTLKIEKDTEIIVNDEPIDDSYQINTSFSTTGEHQIKITVTDAAGKSTSKILPVEVLASVDSSQIKPIEGDFNGDGFIDVGIYNQANGEWKVSLSHAGNFTDRVVWLTNFGDSTDWVNLGGDFNADGKADIGIFNKNTGEFQLALSDGAKFNSIGRILTAADSSFLVPLSGDFNGDGFTDIGVYNYITGIVKIAISKNLSFNYFVNWMENISSPTERIPILGDFNGDGLTDLALFYKSNSVVFVAFSDGKKFIDQGNWITGFGNDKNLIVADFNNDGLMDIGYKDDSNGNWFVALSTGFGFQNFGLWYSNFGSGQDNLPLTGDFNGDGATDIATFNHNNSGLTQWDTQTTDTQTPDLLTEIDNGIGGKTTIEYAVSTQYTNRNLPFSLQVVKKVSVTDTKPDGALEESYIQESKFEGGAFDSQAREFRGFRKATVTDPVTGNYTETYFYQGLTAEEEPFKGQIEKIISYEAGGVLISETQNKYENIVGGTSPHQINFVHLTETTSTVYERLSQLTLKTGFIYDNLGNIIEEINEGDIALSGDEKHAFVKYAPAYVYVSDEAGGFNRVLESRLEDRDGNIASKKIFKYNAKGNLVREENVYLESPADSPVTTFAYDDYGNTTEVRNANNHIVTTQYENVYHTFPEFIYNELSHSISYAYDPKSGLVTSITDANGNTTTTVYDALYRKTEERNADNQIETSYSYPDFNTVQTRQLNLLTLEYIDGLGRKYMTIISAEDGPNPRQVISEKGFDNRGRLEWESLPHYRDEDQSKLAYIRYEYDIRGRIVKITNDFPGVNKDSSVSSSYPSVLTKTLTDPKGNTKTIKTDVYGNNVQITEYIDSAPHITRYEYDIKNNLSKVTDTYNNITEIFYDSLGRKKRLVDPDTRTTQYTYDKMGNLKTQTDAKNQVITFAYDVLSRVKTKTYSITNPGVTYNYDEAWATNPIGRLTSIEDASGLTKYYYDKEGRIIRSDKLIDGITYTFQTQYDILGRITDTIYPDGEIVTYSYDTNSGLLEKVKGLTPQGTVPYAQDITYNAKGQLRQIILGNGTETDYTYGADQLLSRIYTYKDTVALQDLNYIFDSVGNITSIEDMLTGIEKTYTYDSINRLLSATNVPDGKGSLGTIFYKYDAIGNITYKSDVGNYSYGENGAGPHAVTSIRAAYGGRNMLSMGQIPIYGPPIEGTANLDFQYDANGNMISKLGAINSPYAGSKNLNISYQYDAENRLKTVLSNGAPSENYVYDHAGERVKKTDANGITIYIGKLYEKRISTSSTITVKHIFAGQNRIASIESDGTTTNTYYYHPDHLGSTNKVSNNAGLLVNAVEYTPFGQTAQNTLHNGQTVQPTSYLFTGKELDSSGLYYYGARYYDSLIGRFITADPTVARPFDSQDLNRYSYCRNNPLVYVDPSGLSWWSKFWGFIAGIFTFFVSGGNIPLAMAAYSAVDAAIAAAQAGASAWQAAGIALASAAAAYVGAQIGSAFGSWLGGEVGSVSAAHMGSAIFGSIGAFMAGGMTEAALTGGNVERAAMEGAITGFFVGSMVGGLTSPGMSPEREIDFEEETDSLTRDKSGDGGDNYPLDRERMPNIRTLLDELKLPPVTPVPPPQPGPHLLQPKSRFITGDFGANTKYERYHRTRYIIDEGAKRARKENLPWQPPGKGPTKVTGIVNNYIYGTIINLGIF